MRFDRYFLHMFFSIHIDREQSLFRRLLVVFSFLVILLASSSTGDQINHSLSLSQTRHYLLSDTQTRTDIYGRKKKKNEKLTTSILHLFLLLLFRLRSLLLLLFLFKLTSTRRHLRVRAMVSSNQ